MPAWLSLVTVPLMLAGAWKIWEWGTKFVLDRRKELREKTTLQLAEAKDRREQAAEDRTHVEWLLARLREKAELAAADFEREKERASKAEEKLRQEASTRKALPIVLSVFHDMVGKHVASRWSAYLDQELEKVVEILVETTALDRAEFLAVAVLTDDSERQERLKHLRRRQRDDVAAAVLAYATAKTFHVFARAATDEVSHAYHLPLYLARVESERGKLKPSVVAALADFEPMIASLDELDTFSPQELWDEAAAEILRLVPAKKVSPKD